MAYALFPAVIKVEHRAQQTASMGQFETTTGGHRVFLTWMSRYKSVLLFWIIGLYFYVQFYINELILVATWKLEFLH